MLYTPSEVPVSVRNIASWQSVTLRGLTDYRTTVGAVIDTRCVLRDCSGPVLVDGFTSQTAGRAIDFQTQALVVERCAQLTLRNCQLRGFQALNVRDSDVVVENCDLVGHEAIAIPQGLSSLNGPPGVGVVARGGTVTFARCRARGGNGSLLTTAQPAISANGVMIRLCEDSSGSYVAGQQFPSGPTSAIVCIGGTVVRDPSANVVGFNGGPPVMGTDIVRPLPSLHTVAAPPGGTVTADVTTPIGELVLLALSLPGPVTTVPGIDGSFRLDAAMATMQTLGVPAANAPVTHSIAVPNHPELIGARFTWQAIAWSAAHGLRASNPSLYAH